MSEPRTPLWHGKQSRKITRRIVIEGDLVLQTPAHFGSGDESGSLVPLIVDEVENKPLLTGASIAGALRSYLWTYEQGYGKAQESRGLAALLFGGARQDKQGDQSHLIVDDAIGENAKIELRDGVKIDPKSRTAEESKLYTFMVWAAGATFTLRFELLITEEDKDNDADLRGALAVALRGLQNGEITLGARKRRGYGRIKVASWRLRNFDLARPSELIAWIKEGGAALSGKGAFFDVFEALNVSQPDKDADKRERFTIQAKFALESSLLIRADSAVADMGHLRSGNESVLSGTSLAGAIRARALKIANTLGWADAKACIDGMFGIFSDKVTDKRTASRLSVEEHLIEGGESERWVQSRVSLDRFTGGALDTALFDQQPQFGGAVHVNLTLRSPQEREVGLLLMVLKDLWTGDLSLGGEGNVGRGRLKGQTAEVGHNGKTWKLSPTPSGLAIGGDKQDELESYAAAVRKGK